jgi:hypothetical protein
MVTTMEEPIKPMSKRHLPSAMSGYLPPKNPMSNIQRIIDNNTKEKLKINLAEINKENKIYCQPTERLEFDQKSKNENSGVKIMPKI